MLAICVWHVRVDMMFARGASLARMRHLLKRADAARKLRCVVTQTVPDILFTCIMTNSAWTYPEMAAHFATCELTLCRRGEKASKNKLKRNQGPPPALCAHLGTKAVPTSAICVYVCIYLNLIANRPVHTCIFCQHH